MFLFGGAPALNATIERRRADLECARRLWDRAAAGVDRGLYRGSDHVLEEDESRRAPAGGGLARSRLAPEPLLAVPLDEAVVGSVVRKDKAGAAAIALGNISAVTSRPLMEHHDRAHHVLQLTHIARPRIREQDILGRSRKSRELLPVLARERRHKMIGDQEDIAVALTQRRQFQRHDVQAIEEVLAELAWPGCNGWRLGPSLRRGRWSKRLFMRRRAIGPPRRRMALERAAASPRSHLEVARRLK